MRTATTIDYPVARTNGQQSYATAQPLDEVMLGNTERGGNARCDGLVRDHVDYRLHADAKSLAEALRAVAARVIDGPVKLI